MIAVLAGPSPFVRHARCTGSPRRLIGRHGIVPPAEREEDVRGHVQRVGGLRGDAAVAARRTQAERGVHRVVVGVNHVVKGAGVLLVPDEHVLDERGRPHVHGKVPAFDVGAEDGQRMKGLRLVVVGIGRRQLLERRRIRAIPCGLVALTVERVERREIGLLARGWGSWRDALPGWRRVRPAPSARLRGPGIAIADGCA